MHYVCFSGNDLQKEKCGNYPSKSPKLKSSQRSTSGDFSSILHEVISKRSSVIKGTLTIDDLNRYLDEITESMGKQDKQSKILQKIYNRATPDEQRWIVRIILKGGNLVLFLWSWALTLIQKDMNISVKDTSVFGVFHPDAQDLYNMCSDLKKVAWGLWDPNRRLGDEVGCPNPRSDTSLTI